MVKSQTLFVLRACPSDWTDWNVYAGFHWRAQRSAQTYAFNPLPAGRSYKLPPAVCPIETWTVQAVSSFHGYRAWDGGVWGVKRNQGWNGLKGIEYWMFAMSCFWLGLIREWVWWDRLGVPVDFYLSSLFSFYSIAAKRICFRSIKNKKIIKNAK